MLQFIFLIIQWIAVNTFQMKGYLELDGHRLNQTKDRIVYNKHMQVIQCIQFHIM